ncbi:hypothetical protein [Mycobacteroides abscessus]|uniref:hypothetical protein n=1 Tax=Mycobacteroides abscessus TaxID=36809 RepID=UPI001F3169F3|nr:hypothetical protein [Mycobacteroides abscessus]
MMAYEEVGAPIPSGDLYRIKGFGRTLVKIAANIAMNAETPTRALRAISQAMCEERCIQYREAGDTLTLARWLRKHLIALALTPGAEEAYVDIKAALDECRRQIDLPDDDIVIDPARVRAANRSVITLSTITQIANRIGPLGKGLNRDRLRYLTKTGKVRPCGEDPDTGTQFFRLGDVLHGHNDRTKRKRSGGAS